MIKGGIMEDVLCIGVGIFLSVLLIIIAFNVSGYIVRKFK